MRGNKFLGVIKALLIALIILSGAIALPVLFRPFFYWHIEPMELGKDLGLTFNQIKTAYDHMMDFCTGRTDVFSVGVLPWSESGMAHFADVKQLFLLDLWVLVIASALLILLCLVNRRKILLAGHCPGFWSAVGLGAGFALVGGLAATDFDRAFTVFHSLFFPGKGNWLFDPNEDPIILLLPQEFFRNCALLILSVIMLTCLILILWDLWHRKKC